MTRSIGLGLTALVGLAGLVACGAAPDLERMKAAPRQSSYDYGQGAPEVDSGPVVEEPALCAEQTAAYEPQQPKSNIVFALDRSGSMHIRLPNGGTRWTATRDALFALADSLQLSNTRMSVMMFPQGDPTVNDCCKIDESNAVTCTCSSYPEPTERCDATTYQAPSPMELDTAGMAMIKKTVSASDSEFYWGTPLAAAEAAAIGIQAASPNDGVKSVVLLTDGAPTSCETGTNTGANDASLVIDAAKAGFASKDQIRTFVIGVVGGTDAARPDILSQVATAGGTARTEACAADNTCFYSVDTGQLQKQLAEALAKIAREATDCTFDLPAAEATSDPQKVNVTATGLSGMAMVMHDPTQKEGWDYIQNGAKRIKLFGDACTRVQSGDVSKVKVVFGCKTVEESP